MRRRRRARARSDDEAPNEAVVTRAEILLAWAETEDLLAWWGCRRRPEETYLELGRRAGTTLRMPLAVEAGAARALTDLAALATKAEYAGLRLDADEGRGAVEAAQTIRRALLRAASGWQRVRLVVDPRTTAGYR